MSVVVRAVRETSEWDRFERLAREYLDALPFRVDFQDVDRELAQREVEYGPPAGAAFLAWAGPEAVGVVGVRRFADGDAELKRMYVAPAGRGRGAGRALAEAAVAEARVMGYRRLLLDTVDTMVEAIGLYRSLGFVEIDAYRPNPLAGARWFALDLRAPN